MNDDDVSANNVFYSPTKPVADGGEEVQEAEIVPSAAGLEADERMDGGAELDASVNGRGVDDEVSRDIGDSSQGVDARGGKEGEESDINKCLWRVGNP